MGKSFSALALLASVASAVGSPLIKKLYTLPLETFPSAFLLLSACIFASAFCLDSILFGARNTIEKHCKEQEEIREAQDENGNEMAEKAREAEAGKSNEGFEAKE